MDTSTTNFFDSIASAKIGISDNLLLWIISIVLIGVIASIFIFNDSLVSLAFNEDYYWYYIIAILNLANIVAIIYYYLYHNSKYSGTVGEKGSQGKKGKRGNFITCGVCKDNLYLENTKRYEPIIVLSSMLENQLFLGETAFTMENLALNKIAISDIDPTSMIQSVLDPYSPIFNYFMIRYNQLGGDLVYFINNSVLSANIEIACSFSRPTGKVGYLPLGDTAFNSMNANEFNSFLVSGNIRHPVRYETITPFNVPINTSDTNGGTNSPRVQMLNVYKIIPPEGYVALGDCVQRLGQKVDYAMFACVSEKCVKSLPKSEMECVFAHYCLKNLNIMETLATPEKLIDEPNNQLMMTVWRTPMNTIYINTGEDIVNNTLVYNIVNGNTDYLNDAGAVNDDMIEIVKDKILAIPLPADFITLFITSYFTAKMVITFPQKLAEYKTQLLAPFANSKKKPTASDIITISKNTQAFSDNYINNIIKSATSAISTTTTTLDLLTVLFGSNMSLLLAVDDYGIANGGVPIFNVQRLFLRMLKLLFPPNREVYMLKNECLASYKIDEGRQSLIGQLEDTINKYKFLTKQYLNDPSNQCASIDLVNSFQSQAFDKLASYLVGIPDYAGKLESHDYESFNDNRLAYIINIYKSINDVINGKCPKPTS
jgi:hypothetical protein